MNSCTIERRKVVTHSRLNLSTGERRETATEIRVEPCGAPLFGDDALREIPCCTSCRKGWASEGNLPTRAGALAIAKANGEPRPLWTETHPDFPHQPWPDIPPRYADESWRNDEVPKLGEVGGELMIFCDDADPAERLELSCRYILATTEESLFYCEEWPDLIDVLQSIDAGDTPQRASRTQRQRMNQLTLADLAELIEELAELIEEEEAVAKPCPDALKAWRAEFVDKFAAFMVARLGLGWHPDTRAADYVDGEGRSVFSGAAAEVQRWADLYAESCTGCQYGRAIEELEREGLC